MIVELVAGRLIAPHLGSSLYTWTSVIAVILAGMSIGNVIGGRLADRHKPEAILGWLFLASSATCLITLCVNGLFTETRPLKALDWPSQIFFSTLIIFALPAVALGTISPTAAKMALSRSNAVGATLGSFYAWAVVGSILGTFLTGFFLVSALGARGLVLSTALGLALLGLSVGPRRDVHGIWAGLLLALLIISRVTQGS
jgi:MFS family permease